MRCAGIEKDKCRKGINLELTDHDIRSFLNFLHIYVIHVTLLKWVRLSPISLLLWAFISIVPCLLALKTFHLTDVFLCWLTVTILTILVSMAMTIVVVPESTFVISTMIVSIMVVVIVMMVIMIPILVET